MQCTIIHFLLAVLCWILIFDNAMYDHSFLLSVLLCGVLVFDNAMYSHSFFIGFVTV